MPAVRDERARSVPIHADGRRGAIDVARILALLVVVLGHLLLAVIDRHGGEVRGANLLALRPGWAWLAIASPMPIFFAAAGWANATSTSAAAARRLRPLVGLGAVVVAAWSLPVLVLEAFDADSATVGDGARIATQPLWFIAAYAPWAAAAPLVRRLVARPSASIGGGLALLAAVDVLRFGLEGPELPAWAGFFVAWGLPWLVGAWWRDRRVGGGFDERRWGAALLLVGAAAAWILVRHAGYAPALIDVDPARRSNTTPPTLLTAVAALAQVGLLMVAAPLLDRVADRWRKLWDRAGGVAVAVYAWHLSALALCGGAVALGLPTAERLTGLWWAARPLWIALVLAVTAALVAGTSAIRTHRSQRPRPSSAATSSATTDRREGAGRRLAITTGVAMAVASAAGIGLRGPRTSPAAIVLTAGFVASWSLLRIADRASD